MAKKTKNSVIKDANTIPEDAYVTWGDDLDSKKDALNRASSSLDEFTLVQKAEGMRRYGLDYSNLDGLTGSRPGFTRTDYDYFRPDEAVPKKIKAIMRRAEDIYQRVGLVKNVIDLMGDFATQGIRLCHRNKRIERFYRRWFKKINGKDRSERFLNNLYKSGNVVIDRRTAKISLKVSEQLYKSLGAADYIISDIDSKPEKREIPWKYTFIDPVLVDIVTGSLASFVDQKQYELHIPGNLRNQINTPKTAAEQQIIDNLPPEIIEAAKTQKGYPLNSDKTLVFHYKKDDWQAWAYPMIYAIMDDLTVIEKLKLADMAALDGAVSNIRIFKLGNLEHRIAPTKAATAKLAQILGNNTGGGTMDLIWGPDIELLESNTNVHNFLGESKYVPHMNAVYAGLGIPPTLTGTFGAAGTTNNFISLKTLTQRLQYGRDVLTQFWEHEIYMIQKAMGFKYPAKIEFDRMDLSNEESEKALLVQLADRNLISDELLQTRFGFDPDMEKSRLNREHRERKTSRMINKSGPWHDPQLDHSLKKIALQSGIATPSQVGLDLSEKKKNEQTALEMKTSMTQLKNKTTTLNDNNRLQPEQGRPKMSKDSQQRKTKEFAPQTGASLVIWATRAQETISNSLNPILLNFFNKKNLRSLSSSEQQEIENIRTKILFSMEPMSKIDDNSLNIALSRIDSNETQTLMLEYKNLVKSLELQSDSTLSVDEQKQVKASFYSMVYSA